MCHLWVLCGTGDCYLFDVLGFICGFCGLLVGLRGDCYLFDVLCVICGFCAGLVIVVCLMFCVSSGVLCD